MIAFIVNVSAQKKYSNKFIKEKKILAQKLTHENHKNTQIMVDKVFSFAELGFHEVESSKYLTNILENAGWFHADKAFQCRGHTLDQFS